jgi:NAD(P)-dependent dehydrogenase (short-subunit alcohol dehydrogenase family)
MSTSKVILLTGSSRGIGLAAAKFLLQEGHRLVVVARTAGPMEELKGGFPGKVEVVVGDATGEEVSSLPSPDGKEVEHTRTDMALPGSGSPEGGNTRAQLLLATRRPYS